MIFKGSLSDSNGTGPFVARPVSSVLIGAKIFFDTMDLRMGLLNRCFSGEIRPLFLGFPEGGLGMWNGNENWSVIKHSLSANSSGVFIAELVALTFRGFLATGPASSAPPLARSFCFW